MKRVASLIMLLLMLLMSTTAFAEQTTNQFEPMLLNVFDYSAREWFDKEANRALMSVMLAAEASTYDPNFDPTALMTHSSYVLYSEPGMLQLFAFTDDGVYSVAYIPSQKKALGPTFLEGKGRSERAFEMALSYMGDEYHKNSKTALGEAVDFINKEFYNR